MFAEKHSQPDEEPEDAILQIHYLHFYIYTSDTWKSTSYITRIRGAPATPPGHRKRGRPKDIWLQVCQYGKSGRSRGVGDQ